MKRILTILLLLPASTVLAQGTLNYTTRVGGLGGFVGHVYGFEPPPQEGPFPRANPFKYGNTATETPAGTQVYYGGLLTGSGFSAQLFYAPGLDQPEYSLIALPGSVTTFRTGATFAGTIVPSFVTLPGVPVGGSATLQLRAWNNLGGTLTSWAQAEPFWSLGTISAGNSDLFNISGLTSNVDPAPPAMTGFRSFNINVPGSILPEPSTYALLTLGGLAWLFLRRKP